MLSRGFFQLEKRHSIISKRVKSLLPRRESERRSHPLARHCDILQSIETRISMLNMTYVKFMESNLLCFIPGKVLDEMRNVLAIVESDQTPPRTHQLLQELRDLSSMAMEHFDEHILPRVKEQVNKRSAISYGSVASCSKTPRVLFTNQSISNEIHKVKKQSKTHKHHISYLTQSTLKLYQKLRKQNLRIKAQSVKIREQEKKIQEQNSKIEDQEAALAGFKKHIEEWDQKYKDLNTELIKAREDILTAISQRSPVTTLVKPATTISSINSITSTHLLDLGRKRKSPPACTIAQEIPVKRNIIDNQSSSDPLSVFRKIDTIQEHKEHNRNDLESIVESILYRPNVKNRKRKMAEDIDLKY